MEEERSPWRARLGGPAAREWVTGQARLMRGAL